MADHLIEFLRHADVPADVPAPFPAGRAVPDWLKQMPADQPIGPGGADVGTVKKCPPFVDALACGYLIPLAADVRLTMSAAALRFECELPLVQSHPTDQFPGAPFEGVPLLKFLNPWVVRTPPGYSCLFVQPLNRFDLPFNVLSGVVETDTYYREVNFPSVCMLEPGQTAVLEKGTPIAQLIPIRRESWASRAGPADMARRRAANEAFLASRHAYKDEHWKRKGYE